MDGTILVADDDRTIRTVLTQALTRAGCKVHATSSLTTLMRWVGEGKGDAVISDVIMPDGNGLEMLPKIAQDRPGLPVIVISAQNTIMTAIKANEAEAFDYLPKPFDLPDLMKRTARALEQSVNLPRRGGSAPDEASAEGDDLPMIGRTPVMQALYRAVAQVLNSDLPVLIRGESGTGKSLIGRAIHDLSDRRSLPFITLTEMDLVEVDGPAQLLARLRGGTLMIDEVADLPLEHQARLVRMLDMPGAKGEGSDAPSFIATSQADLEAAIEDGSLRRDLYFRLTGATIDVPALRDRVEDIPLLAGHCSAHAHGAQQAVTLSDAAARALQKAPWPGNVRQLEHTIRQLAQASLGGEVTESDVTRLLGAQSSRAPLQKEADNERMGASVERHLRRYFDLHGAMLPPPGLYARILREVELPLIEIALAATAGNQAKCAALLGINRNTLRKKITDLDIEVTRGRKMM